MRYRSLVKSYSTAITARLNEIHERCVAMDCHELWVEVEPQHSITWQITRSMKRTDPVISFKISQLVLCHSLCKVYGWVPIENMQW